MQRALTTDEASYLVFSLRESLYALPATAVLEAVWLPELTPMAEAPPYVAGLVNVRGRVVPVTDLALRLGFPQRPYQLTDSVILLEIEDGVAGMLVDEVREVYTIHSQDIGDAPRFDNGREAASRFVGGVATTDQGIIAVLDMGALFGRSEQVRELPAETEETAPVEARQGFCPEASAEERELYHARALQLRQSIESQDLEGFVPLAVVSLGGEYYGLELELIREFAPLEEITPVPCCPRHIVGNINLRGEVLTLIDVCGVLSLAASEDRPRERAVVVEIDDLCVGVLVDEVFDVAYLRPGEIATIPTALKTAGDDYLKGTVRHGDTTLGILDLREILGREELTVDEEV